MSSLLLVEHCANRYSICKIATEGTTIGGCSASEVEKEKRVMLEEWRKITSVPSRSAAVIRSQTAAVPVPDRS